MRILISGFEPFNGRKINQSWETARTFIGIEGIDVVCLPVSFSRAHQILINKLQSRHYDLIIMLGETSTTRDAIRLERVALNLKDSAIKDNDGFMPDEEKIHATAPPALFTGFPIKSTIKKLQNDGVKARISNSAGTFVCNNLYFQILYHLSLQNSSTTALFVHLPSSTEAISSSRMQAIVTQLISLSKPSAVF